MTWQCFHKPELFGENLTGFENLRFKAKVG